MSSMASNYDMNRLVSGQVMATAAAAISVTAACLALTMNTGSLLPFILVTVSYGVMMFASSYVEEEHHFWYWMSSAWFAILGLKNFNR